MIDINKINIGDHITFRAPTRGTGNAKATRVVNDIIYDGGGGGHVTVGYAGYHKFYVRPDEILCVHLRANA